MSRKLTLISPRLGDLLVKQIAHELKNYNLYKSFANYYANEGYDTLAEYFTKRAQEELLHHEWVFDYLTDGDYKFMYPAIEMNSVKIGSMIDPFIASVEREIETTQMIYAIYKLSMEEGDLMTCSWLLEKLIKEQVEEENTSRTARTIMETDDSMLEKAEAVLELLEK